MRLCSCNCISPGCSDMVGSWMMGWCVEARFCPLLHVMAPVDSEFSKKNSHCVPANISKGVFIPQKLICVCFKTNKWSNRFLKKEKIKSIIFFSMSLNFKCCQWHTAILKQSIVYLEQRIDREIISKATNLSIWFLPPSKSHFLFSSEKDSDPHSSCHSCQSLVCFMSTFLSIFNVSFFVEWSLEMKNGIGCL